MTRIRVFTITAALLLILIAALLLVLSRRDGDTSTPAGIPSPAATSANPAPTAGANPAPTTSVDPYETYLKLAPKGSLHLSREDAQARAYLGCGQSWAPGTVDAALAVAYKDLCKRGG